MTHAPAAQQRSQRMACYFNRQAKVDLVKKGRNYQLFNMTAYRFFSIKKCLG